MARIYETSTLDDRLNSTLFIDHPNLISKGYLLEVNTDGRFSVLLEDCDKIVTLNLFDPMIKVFG